MTTEQVGGFAMHRSVAAVLGSLVFFETGHLLFKVKKLRAEPQEPLPEPTGCPTD